MISNNTSPVNEFSPELWETIEKSIQIAIQSGAPRIAAFDADGTLWDQDAGETFFDWEIKNAGLKNLPPDPWAHYFALKKIDPITAYIWLAQINEGIKLSEVRDWAKTCFSEIKNWPVFESQKKLISFLRSFQFEVYIVTASIKWAVEPIASLVGVDSDHVLGVATETIDGIVTKQGVFPVTWRQGKADGLLAATRGARPILASGNTYGDIAMLETATHVRLAITTQNKPGGLFEEESKLAIEANQRGWLRHRFRE